MNNKPVIKKGYVDTPKGQIHYRMCGEGEPLVLVHCTSDSSTMWEPVLPVFGRLGYKAVAFDVPGHGESDPPPEKPDAAEYARRIDEAAQLMGLKRYHILGHHFGATVAAWVAVNHGEHIGKLIVYGLPLISEQRRAEMLDAKPRVFDREGNEVRRHWVRRWDQCGIGLPEGQQSVFNSEMGLRTMIALLQVGSNWYYAYHTIASTDHEALARKIRVPTLVMSGPRDHFWKPMNIEEESRYAPTLFPNARYAILQDAGVDGADEYPEEFCRIVDQFIRGKS